MEMLLYFFTRDLALFPGRVWSLEEDMPLFEYTCLECGNDFELLVLKSSEMDDLKCPVCGGNRLEQKVSAFASISDSGASSVSNCAPSGG